MSYKKFTNLSGAKVGQQPKVVAPTNEEIELLEFKNSVMKLIDDFLSIRSFGVARPEIMIPTRIVGKELFVEALGDLLSQKTTKEVVKNLESLKSTNSDWKSIDEKIDSFKSDNKNFKEEKKIEDLISKWGDDIDSLKAHLNLQMERLSDSEISEKLEVSKSLLKRLHNPELEIVIECLSKRLGS